MWISEAGTIHRWFSGTYRREICEWELHMERRVACNHWVGNKTGSVRVVHLQHTLNILQQSGILRWLANRHVCSYPGSFRGPYTHRCKLWRAVYIHFVTWDGSVSLMTEPTDIPGFRSRHEQNTFLSTFFFWNVMQRSSVYPGGQSSPQPAQW
jgi:hypothetical protein